MHQSGGWRWEHCKFHMEKSEHRDVSGVFGISSSSPLKRQLKTSTLGKSFSGKFSEAARFSADSRCRSFRIKNAKQKNQSGEDRSEMNFRCDP